VVIRRGLPRALQPVGQEADGVVVFGMHHDQGAGLARHGHDLQHLAVRQREALIGHEHLEGGVAVLDQRRQFLPQDLLGRIGDDQMERHVDVAAPFRLGVIGFECLAQGLAFELQAKRQHGRVPAQRRRARAALEIVRHDDVRAGRLREMNVAVDAAGEDELARCIDDLRRLSEVVAKRGDAAVANADVAGEGVGGGHHGSAANDDVEPTHVGLPGRPRRPRPGAGPMLLRHGGHRSPPARCARYEGRGACRPCRHRGQRAPA
jgi:hypothetical protein